MTQTGFNETVTLAEMVLTLTEQGCNEITRVLPDKENTGCFIVEWE